MAFETGTRSSDGELLGRTQARDRFLGRKAVPQIGVMTEPLGLELLGVGAPKTVLAQRGGEFGGERRVSGAAWDGFRGHGTGLR